MAPIPTNRVIRISFLHPVTSTIGHRSTDTDTGGDVFSVHTVRMLFCDIRTVLVHYFAVR